jgi:hypothetical protein
MDWFGRIALGLSLASSPVWATEPGAGPFAFTLSAKAFDERCLELAAGEALRYHFRASAPLDFNVHTHRGHDVFYPVRNDSVQQGDGTFRADAAGEYCLMWTHRGDGRISVEGTVERAARR